MRVCTMVLYRYTTPIGIDGHSLSGNMHVQDVIYMLFYHPMVYVANEEDHVRIYPGLVLFELVNWIDWIFFCLFCH